MFRYGSDPEDYLFHGSDWFATQEKWKRELLASIENMNGDELLNTSTTDLAIYYADKYKFEVPTIHPDELVVDQREAQIDVSRDRSRYFGDHRSPFYVTGTSIDVELPFTGNKVGFKIQPSTRNFNNPRAAVKDGV